MRGAKRKPDDAIDADDSPRWRSVSLTMPWTPTTETALAGPSNPSNACSCLSSQAEIERRRRFIEKAKREGGKAPGSMWANVKKGSGGGGN